ncbi:MAG: CaiB/BaiF CoA transferase family protein [Methyloligellaceae bacterium]
MTSSLKGIIVVSLEQAVAAPYCSSRLADAGARVIKVERPDGDFARGYDHVVHGESAYFVWLNRGKESLAIDIKDPENAVLLHTILARADVFIQNLSPGAAERAGFGSDLLRKKYPRLITCDISGYGETGDYRDMRAYDLLVQAETGLASITGNPEGPGRVGVSVADISCGMYALTAILEALIRRQQTGKGEGLKVSLFSSIADWMAVPLLHHDYAAQAPVRSGLSHPSIAPYGIYGCGDGQQLLLSIQNEREWQRFCSHVLGDAAIAEDPRLDTNSNRVKNRPYLDTLIGEVFGGLTRDELVERLNFGDIAYGSYNDVAAFSDHPQLQRISVDTPSGPALMPGPPVSGWRGDPEFGEVPALGAHNETILQEFHPPVERTEDI